MTYRTMQALGLAVTLLQRAMEKCDRRTDIPRRHRAGSQLDHQRAALLMRSSNGLPSRTNVCTRRKRTCGPQGGSEKATLSGGCGSTGHASMSLSIFVCHQKDFSAVPCHWQTSACLHLRKSFLRKPDRRFNAPGPGRPGAAIPRRVCCVRAQFSASCRSRIVVTRVW